MQALFLQTVRRPHVLIATPLFPPEVGGPATYTKLLSEHLPQEGFTVSVLAFREVRHLPKGVRHAVYFFKALARAEDADVIFAQDPTSVGLPAALAARIMRKPFLLKIVGDRAWETAMQRAASPDGWEPLERFSTHWSGAFNIFLLQLAQRVSARIAKAIITPSAYLRAIVANWGVPEKKVHVIYNAFDPPDVQETKVDARRRLSLSGTVLVSAGRLVPWKGFVELADVVCRMSKDIPELRLYIIGEGPERARLEAHIQEIGAQQVVFLLGRQEKTTVFSYMRASDIFVLYTGYEGFSHTLLEAMASGAPVLTTAVGGNPELLTDKKEGLLVPYNDKTALAQGMKQLLQDAAQRERLGRNARIRVRQFATSDMIARTLALLKNI